MAARVSAAQTAVLGINGHSLFACGLGDVGGAGVTDWVLTALRGNRGSAATCATKIDATSAPGPRPSGRVWCSIMNPHPGNWKPATRNVFRRAPQRPPRSAERGVLRQEAEQWPATAGFSLLAADARFFGTGGITSFSTGTARSGKGRCWRCGNRHSRYQAGQVGADRRPAPDRQGRRGRARAFRSRTRLRRWNDSCLHLGQFQVMRVLAREFLP